ncbi:MAG TPA: hypothetical protein VJ455_09905 [Ignavibacteria bacterium]|nr:hypothetical protein [Ignavibacteria bacterium]
MMYRLAKIFCVSPGETGNMSEYDFWVLTGFENLDNKRREYYLNQDKK